MRAFERGPLRYYCCQDYGHVGAVCRRGMHRCTGVGGEGKTGVQNKIVS